MEKKIFIKEKVEILTEGISEMNLGKLQNKGPPPFYSNELLENNLNY